MLEQLGLNYTLPASTVFIGIALLMVVFLGAYNLLLVIGFFYLLSIAPKSSRAEPAWQRTLQDNSSEMFRQQQELERQRWAEQMQAEFESSRKKLDSLQKEITKPIFQEIKPIQTPNLYKTPTPKEQIIGAEEQEQRRKLDSMVDALKLELEEIKRKNQ